MNRRPTKMLQIFTEGRSWMTGLFTWTVHRGAHGLTLGVVSKTHQGGFKRTAQYKCFCLSKGHLPRWSTSCKLVSTRFNKSTTTSLDFAIYKMITHQRTHGTVHLYTKNVTESGASFILCCQQAPE